jgi:integrase
MTVYDRWHKTHPNVWTGDGQDPAPKTRDRPCKCGRGKNKLYPTAVHGVGKRWQVRWRDEAGRQPKRNFTERYGDDPEQHAEAFDKKVGAELDAGTYVPAELGKVTLAEFAKQWRAGLTADPNSLENIDRRLKHICGTGDDPTLIARTPMSDLAKRPSMIQQWIKGLQAKKLAPGYIKDIKNSLSSIFIAAIEDGIAHKNPTRSSTVRLPPRTKKLIEPWTPAMLAAARSKLEELHGCGAEIGDGAGLRQGEIFAIAEDDIVFLGRRAERKIKVRRQIKLMTNAEGKRVPVFAPPKRGKTREARLSDALGRKLSAHMETHPPQDVTLPWEAPGGKPVTVRLVFVRSDGKPWTRKTFDHTWHAARDAAGAAATRENGMHVLRHTYASMNLAKGVDVIKVATWIGHEDPGFTYKVYGHFIPDLTEVGGQAVDEFLEPGEQDGTGTEAAGDVP